MDHKRLNFSEVWELRSSLFDDVSITNLVSNNLWNQTKASDFITEFQTKESGPLFKFTLNHIRLSAKLTNAKSMNDQTNCYKNEKKILLCPNDFDSLWKSLFPKINAIIMAKNQIKESTEWSWRKLVSKIQEIRKDTSIEIKPN